MTVDNEEFKKILQKITRLDVLVNNAGNNRPEHFTKVKRENMEYLTNLNMKAAFLHNLADALGSIGVILAGALIIMYQLYWVDTLIAFVISGFVFWQAIKILPKTIHILMEGTPEDLSSVDIKLEMEKIDLVEDVHHIHVWNIDEHRVALEAHVVVNARELRDAELIKASLKEMLSLNFNINHSTLEFEHQSEKKCE